MTLPQISFGLDDDDLPAPSRRTVPPRRPALEAEPEHDAHLEVRHPQRTAKDLPQRPCAGCGRSIVVARDLSRRMEVLLDPARPVYIEIGSGVDGVPLVAHAANGLALHQCEGSR